MYLTYSHFRSESEASPILEQGEQQGKRACNANPSAVVFILGAVSETPDCVIEHFDIIMTEMAVTHIEKRQMNVKR